MDTSATSVWSVTLISVLRNTDESAFGNYSRMNVAAIEDLLSRVAEHIVVKQRTRWRATIVRKRLSQARLDTWQLLSPSLSAPSP